MRKLLLLCLLSVLGYSQTASQPGTTARRIVTAASLPATCTVGDVYFKTAATVGTYQCLTTNNWTAIAGGGGGGATIPSVTNLIKGDGAGNGADSGIAATSIPTSLTGDATGTVSANAIATSVVKINGVALSGLATGLLKNTTTTGAPSIAAGSDICGLLTLTGDVTTSAACATTIANLAVTNAKIANSTIDLTAKVTGVLPNANTTAASANTASAIVTRDGSGNFTAGTITASLTGHASSDFAVANNLSEGVAATMRTNLGLGTAALISSTCSGTDLTGTLPGCTVQAIGGKTVSLSGNFTTSGAFNPTFAIPSSSTWTFPSGGGTLSTTTGTVTSVAQSFTGGLISVGGSPITSSGTIALTVEGTSGGIPYFSGATTWASSALLPANAVLIGGGAGSPPTGNAIFTWNGTSTVSITDGSLTKWSFYNQGPIQFSQASTNTIVWFNGTNIIGNTSDIGLDRDAAGIVGVTNGTQGTTAANYRAIKASAHYVAGTTFTASGCSNGTLVGGATAGSYNSGTTGTCTVTVTMGNSATATNGWACSVWDTTTAADVQTMTASTTTTATFSGTTISGDVIKFACMGY